MERRTKRDFLVFIAGALTGGVAANQNFQKFYLQMTGRETGLDRLSSRSATDDIIDVAVEKHVEETRFSMVDGTTRQFEALKKEYPLDEIRRSVLKTNFENGDNPTTSSAVLLDDQGLIGMSAHQVHGEKCDVFFNPKINSLGQSKATVRIIDTTHDIALAQLDDQTVISKSGMVPIKRIETTYEIDDKSNRLYVAFYDWYLHAVIQESIAFRETFMMAAAADKKIEKLCSAITKGSSHTWSGMSGCGVFSETGDYHGVFNAKNAGISFYTPAPLMWKLVDNYKNKISNTDDPNAPEACRIKREQSVKSFFTLKP